MNLRSDRSRLEHVLYEDNPWVPSPEPNIERKLLERDGGEIARATSIVRYRANSAFPQHRHARGEEFIVLDGIFADEQGQYGAGTYVRNPPGSTHRPFSVGGCTLFVKLRQSAPDDSRRCVIGPEEGIWQTDNGLGRRLLHSFGSERVSLVKMAAGSTIDLGLIGVELLVLRGSLTIGARPCATWTWLRTAHALEPMVTTTECEIWLKEGHLSRF